MPSHGMPRRTYGHEDVQVASSSPLYWSYWEGRGGEAGWVGRKRGCGRPPQIPAVRLFWDE